VLPVELVARLENDQIRCILCHELGHLTRRDPWISFFAFLTRSVYWWNPVAWIAHREVLSAQEECCDALVMARTGISRKTYAAALFETIEFIHNVRPSSPVLATGFGRSFFARRRFEMIAKPMLDRRVLVVVPLVVLLGVGFLALPVRGQTTEKKAAKNAKANVYVESDSLILWHTGDGDAVVTQAKRASSAVAPKESRLKPDFGKTGDVKVDPKKHCLYVGMQPYEGCENGTLRIDLEKGVTYTVTCSGEALMSDEGGGNADPYEGIVFGYQTDEQDCHAVRNKVLKPGDSVTFTTPTCIGFDEDVFAVAFFLQAWPHRNGPDQRGSYTLKFTRTQPEVSFTTVDIGLQR
jgi:hypothetical protein